MKGDLVKVVNPSTHSVTTTAKGYRAHSDQNGNPVRDKRMALVGMVSHKEFPIGTIGQVDDGIEKVLPNLTEAVPVRFKKDQDDIGEVWYFPLSNLEIVT